ncbi:hypothetical protein [Slackia heliotrinireducens]|uniref:Uncharacterized protein n=1 Tax=Slackia heliotrinireducens (strain ATCC 29202 / DSM 20476 / NCTC 11029 / RHS 1) TaxID=471855 RepID=C7N125_SLAHD|nr:hypothetical protein [Slackia heliotrinireducens]ACV23247.1 hypothetical protein Shel_22370 [Slackia heliotrinireducens DSM 20476]VEH02387.1 Uncharacterised protein [Slackia heliotrinireducens]
MARYKVKFSSAEKKLLARLGLEGNYGQLTNDELFAIDEVVTEFLMDEGIDDEGNVTEQGRICEQIIEKLAEVDG